MPERSLNIGFVSVWFERGQAYVTKTLRDALAVDHHVFILVRTGRVYGEKKIETRGYWDVPGITIFPEYEIPPDFLIRWIEENHINVVIFNEEYDWALVEVCKEKGIKVLTYLDYFEEDWLSRLPIYHAVLCSTRRTHELVKKACNARYIGWAVDTDLFRPNQNGDRKYTFFHNAGWLGINYRKMTPAVIAAFDIVSRRFGDCSILVHAQAEKDKLPNRIIEILRRNPRIDYHVATIPAPGLYHKGRVLVFPSKLEGLGLPLLEGLSCGLPAIATDAPPMTEFIRDGENGLLVSVSRTAARGDSIAFKENFVEVKDLAFKMAQLAAHPEQVDAMSKKARQSALELLNPAPFKERLLEAISYAANG